MILLTRHGAVSVDTIHRRTSLVEHRLRFWHWSHANAVKAANRAATRGRSVHRCRDGDFVCQMLLTGAQWKVVRNYLTAVDDNDMASLRTRKHIESGYKDAIDATSDALALNIKSSRQDDPHVDHDRCLLHDGGGDSGVCHVVELLTPTHDDGGRSQSKRPRQSRDCVVRAIAIAFEEPYDSIYDSLATGGRLPNRSTPKGVWQPYINSRRDQSRLMFPAEKGKRRMTLEAFIDGHPVGRFVVQCAGHVTAVVDGNIHDIDKLRAQACVYAAWKAKR